MPTQEQLTRFRNRIHEEADKLPDAALLDTLLYVEENQRLFAPRHGAGSERYGQTRLSD